MKKTATITFTIASAGELGKLLSAVDAIGGVQNIELADLASEQGGESDVEHVASLVVGLMRGQGGRATWAQLRAMPAVPGLKRNLWDVLPEAIELLKSTHRIDGKAENAHGFFLTGSENVTPLPQQPKNALRRLPPKEPAAPLPAAVWSDPVHPTLCKEQALVAIKGGAADVASIKAAIASDGIDRWTELQLRESIIALRDEKKIEWDGATAKLKPKRGRPPTVKPNGAAPPAEADPRQSVIPGS
jgi:hypothetical protein